MAHRSLRSEEERRVSAPAAAHSGGGNERKRADGREVKPDEVEETPPALGGA